MSGYFFSRIEKVTRQKCSYTYLCHIDDKSGTKEICADVVRDIRSYKRREKPRWLYVIGNKYDRNRYLELTPIGAAPSRIENH